MSRDSFEVYYHQNGRWQLHATFEANQRDQAIAEAQTVETKEGYATRVVRETYIAETNTTENAITWQSQKAKTINDTDDMFGTGGAGGKGPQKGGGPKKKAPPPQQQQAPRPWPQKPAPAPQPAAVPKQTQQKSAAFQPAPVRQATPKKGKGKKKKRGVLMRLFMVFGLSLAMAGVGALAVTVLIGIMISLGMLPQANRFPIVAGAFVLIFFAAVFANLQKQFNLLSMLKKQPQKRAAPGPDQMMQALTRKPKPAQDVEFDQVSIEDLREKVLVEDQLADESAAEDAAMDAEDAPPALGADMGAEMSAEMDMGAQVHAAPEPTPAEAAPPPPPPEPKKEAPPPPKPEEKKAPEKPQGNPAENEARTGFTKFIADAMRQAPSDLNAFTRFGLNLYVAGAASVIGQSKRLDRDTQLSVLKQGLQSAGNPADRAETFCVELPSYGKNPKYAGMVKAGVAAMTDYLKGNTGVVGQIPALLQEWNLPEKRAAIPSIITFVFTDIVGSTAMTQRLGNAGAQKAVRAHNTAVRGAIQAYKGREVKHTGDGIMATFPDAPSAVVACMKIQREIAAHNAANPNIDVHLRIGINAGEAVEEENDFFGAAVQMTARICDKASKDNIWVSQAVVDACKGQKVGFIPRGAFEMKGIQGSKRLFEVGWSDAHKNELADL